MSDALYDLDPTGAADSAPGLQRMLDDGRSLGDLHPGTYLISVPLHVRRGPADQEASRD